MNTQDKDVLVDEDLNKILHEVWEHGYNSNNPNNYYVNSYKERCLTENKEKFKQYQSKTPPLSTLDEDELELLAKEYASGMMGYGEYSEKWDYADKVLYNTILKAYKQGYKAALREGKRFSEQQVWTLLEHICSEGLSTTPHSRSWAWSKRKEIETYLKSLMTT